MTKITVKPEKYRPESSSDLGMQPEYFNHHKKIRKIEYRPADIDRDESVELIQMIAFCPEDENFVSKEIIYKTCGCRYEQYCHIMKNMRQKKIQDDK